MENSLDDKIKPLQTFNEFKQNQVYNEIKTDILNNTYPAGTVMIERRLCEIYNVSRSPIRNALQQLSHEGLLSFQPGKGAVVTEFNIEDILEVYDLIELLQTFAIGSFINRLSDLSVETLEDILNKMNTAIYENNLFLSHEWDQKFHSYIITFSGNHRLLALYEILNNQSKRFQASTVNDKELAQKSYEEHNELFNDIKDKNIEKAKETVKLHYHNIKQYYITKLLNR